MYYNCNNKQPILNTAAGESFQVCSKRLGGCGKEIQENIVESGPSLALDRDDKKEIGPILISYSTFSILKRLDQIQTTRVCRTTYKIVGGITKDGTEYILY
jgi:hypothetical protein